jgi:hypothetical protein
VLFEEGQVGFVGFAALADEVADGLADGVNDECTTVLSVEAADGDDNEIVTSSLDITLAEDVLLELETGDLEADNLFGRARILPAANSAAI